MKKAFFLLSLFWIALPLNAGTLSVPGDYATIQEAIDSSQAGDTILVSAATYPENITIGHALTIIGTISGSDTTTIVGAAASGPTVSISATSTLSNLIVLGGPGTSTSQDGGMAIQSSGSIGVSILTCRISGGDGFENLTGGVSDGGSALSSTNADVEIRRSQITGGSGGVSDDFGSPVIANRATTISDSAGSFVLIGCSVLGGFGRERNGVTATVDLADVSSIEIDSCQIIGGTGLETNADNGIEISNCPDVLISHSSINGGNGSNQDFSNVNGGHGIILTAGANVILNQLTVTGGNGPLDSGDGVAGKGGDGIQADSCSNITITSSDFTGGLGGNDDQINSSGGDGGSGAIFTNCSNLQASLCDFKGSKGGRGNDAGTPGDGGYGVVIENVMSTAISNVNMTGGEGGKDNAARFGSNGGTGLKIVASTATTVGSCIIDGGDAGEGSSGSGGDGIYVQQSDLDINDAVVKAGHGQTATSIEDEELNFSGGRGIRVVDAAGVSIGSSDTVYVFGGNAGNCDDSNCGDLIPIPTVDGGAGISISNTTNVTVFLAAIEAGDGGFVLNPPDSIFGPGGHGMEALSSSSASVASGVISQPGTGNPDGQPFYADSTSTINSLSDTSLTLTSPNGGESWGAGTNRQITWTSNGVTGNVRLEYDAGAPTENGVPWILIDASTPNDGSYLWSVPNNPTSGALVRVSAVNDPGIQDVSDGAFTITGSALAVTRPNGAESFSIGAKENVNWNPGGLSGTVRLEYSTNNGANWSVIQASVANDGNFKWTVPATASAQSLVRVTSNLVPSITDVSDAVFTIGASAFALTNPTGGENWTVGSAHYIQWNPDGLGGTVALWYSTDGGAGWTSIDAATLNDGSFKWFIPNQVTAQAQVRIETNLTPSNADTSGDFTISAPGLLLIRPNGGESFVVGTKESIFWNTGGLSGTVRLEYSTDGGGSFSIIKASVANDGNFRWLVPNDVTAQARVRVSSNSAPSIADTSDNDFAISLTLPKGGQVGELIPEVFGIYQNFPNPFNPSTQIRYDLPEASEVTLKVYNMLGKEVSTLAQGMKPAGIHFSTFDATGLSSGIYIYRIQAKGFSQKVYTQILKMVYVK